MEKQLRFTLSCALMALTLLASACGQDIKQGGQYVGQRCFEPSDCAQNLTCRGRICVPIGSGASDMSPDLSGDMATDLSKDQSSDLGPDLGPDMVEDIGEDMVIAMCRVGQRACLGERTYQECIRQGNQTTFVRRTCPDDSVCENGRCVDVCIDRDGDGFFANCDPVDCNDTRRSINPAAPEVCGNNRDDNCNGQRDEGCMMGGCCDGGCGPQEFCSQCVCEPFDPNICRTQDQPCNNEGDFSNGFFCGDITGAGVNRCIGVCQINAADPDSTCPDPNTVCAFEANDQGQGICLATCNLAQGCGPGLGCVAYDNTRNDGICVPNNPNNRIGSQCDPQLFFDCEEGGICVQDQQGGFGECVQACRPFADPNSTDCSMGNYCQVASDRIGTCQPNNGFREGDMCRPFGSSCGEDAVGCYPFDGNQPTCTRLCRVDQGAADCNGAASCVQFDPDSNIGFCDGVLPP